MQARLSWPAARSLAASGSRVRRAAWTDRYVFRTAGGLHWLGAYDESYKRVVQAEDFQRAEFLALDWTDADPDQNHCVGISFENYKAGEVVAPTEGHTIPGTPYVPGYKKLNPPSWGAQSGNLLVIAPGFSGGDLAPGTYWRNYSLGKTELVTYTEIPPVPATPDIFVPGSDPIPTSNYGEKILINPFTAPAQVVLSGSVWDSLLLNGVVARTGPGAIDPVSFTIPAGGSFKIAARSGRSDYPFFIGYDLEAAITV